MRPKKMKDEIKRSFFTYAIVVVTVIFFVYLLLLSIVFRLTIIEPNEANHEHVLKDIETGFAAYYSGMDDLISASTIHSFLETGEQAGDAYKILYDFRNHQSFHADFLLLDGDEEVVATSFYSGSDVEARSSVALNALTYKLEGAGVVGTRLTSPLRDVHHRSSYVFSAAIQGEEGLLGYLFYFLDSPSFPDQHYVYVTDLFDNVIFSTYSYGLTTLGKLDLDLKGNWITYEGEMFYKTQTTLSKQGIQVITATPMSIYRLLVLYGVLTMLISSIAILLVVWFVAPKIVAKSLQPFDGLVALMASKKKYSHLDHEPNYEEVEIIYEEYRSRVSEVERLLDENQIIMEKKRISELKHLEAKFNPHFLFNVLEMIKYELMEDPQSASDMIVKTATLMRYNANFGQTLVPLEEDIRYLNDYFSLQKMRYGKRLHYEITVNPLSILEEAFIPKLLIQPLIENAIKHNIHKTHSLFIQVVIKTDGNELTIEIRDNGKGLNEKKVAEIKAIYLGEKEASEQTGLHTVHQLIQLLYGEDYGLMMRSHVEDGTIMTLTLPLQKG
ncbi:sensor histidine kinase [Shouchella lehensis]|uniref:Two-component sensor histidine kinase n=1 Tax=Shouchella lehensis G1 TaxID=1246626 RepID=A0A060LSZ7_9BACI|nr:histidine kinase [Shouchella lehensis]AIC94381.1 two-component sensor histidine kinase [Shouchella lehensis G1]